MAGKTWIWDMGKKARGTVRILQREKVRKRRRHGRDYS
jgi:hypothetical protein